MQNEISLCTICFCMTHTVNGLCGKCKSPKPDTDSKPILCEKKRYKTEEEANQAANRVMIEYNWDPMLRVYKCHTCHNWHLTSKANA